MNTNQEANGDYEFHCPHCTQSLAASMELIGASIDCPSCGVSIEVPSPILEENKNRHTPSLSFARVIPTQPLLPIIDSPPKIPTTPWQKLRERLIVIGDKTWDLLVIAFDKKPSPSKIRKKQIERDERKEARLIKDVALPTPPKKAASPPSLPPRDLSIISRATYPAEDATFDIVNFAPSSSSSGMRVCPFCSEEIKGGALKCKHCGEFLDVRLRQQVASPLQNNPQPQQVHVVVKQQSGCAWIIIIVIGIIAAVVLMSLL